MHVWQKHKASVCFAGCSERIIMRVAEVNTLESDPAAYPFLAPYCGIDLQINAHLLRCHQLDGAEES